MNKIKIYPQHYFDSEMKRMGLDDTNVEEQNSTAFISIICTKDCNDGYMVRKHGKGDQHHFKSNHSNVLNLGFDDLEQDLEKDGVLYKAFTREQAKETVEFILNNPNKNYIIHCHAGVSRSAGIGQFIRDYFDWVNKDRFDLEVKPKINPNQKVYSELKKAYEELSGLETYETFLNNIPNE